MQFQPNAELSVSYFEFELDSSFPTTSPSHDNYSPFEVTDEPVYYLHYHNCLELGYCYEGSGVFIVDNQIYHFTAGNAVIIFAQEMHIARANEGSVCKWDFINLDPDIMLSGLSPDLKADLSVFLTSVRNFPSVISKSDYPQLVWLIREIADELKLQRVNYKSTVRALVWCLMTNLTRYLLPKQDNKSVLRRDLLLRISPAINYMMMNYSKIITIPELAELCNMSQTSFRRTFADSVGLSPLEYLTQIRMKMACIELQTKDTTILEIALNLGYASVSSFNRHFLHHMKMTPSEWRKSVV